MNTRKTLFLGCGALVALFVGTNVASAALDPVGSFTVRRGATGAAGTDGKSAYDIWKDAGNTGSEADFLASLVGKDGTPGTNGTNGCATTLSKATSTDATTGKKTVTVTAKDCNNNTLWTETVQDGTDGAAGQDGAPGCADEVTVSEKDANECITITKTPYSLVNGTCTPGTTESQKVCEPKVCEPVISTTKDASTKCVTYSTQKRKANAAGTACENDGAADTEVVCPLECESHEVSVPCGPAASGASELCEIATKKGIKTTKYKCDGTTVDGVVYTYDGDDAPDQCEGLSAADKASQIIKTSSVYKRPEGQQGYKEVTTVNCNNVTNTTYEYDPCGEVHAETVTSTVPNCNLTDGNAVMGCTDQTNQTKYYICQKIADSEAGVVPLGAMMEANKDQLQTEINKKLNTTDLGTALKDNSVKTDLADAVAGSGALSGYSTTAQMNTALANKADTSALSSYLQTANLGTALKDNSVKTDLADAVAGSGALSGYATNTSVTSAVAGKADKTELDAYLKTNDLGTALKDNSVKTDLADAVAGSGALTGYLTSADASSTYATQTALNTADGKITALEATVGDSNSGLVKQVATNTSTIGNASGGLVKDVADAKTSAANAVSTANTASTNATLAKQDAASALNGLDDKLNKTDAQSTYLSKTDATSTYLKQTDASSTYLTQNNASSTYATKSALTTVETTANNAANNASSALSTAQSAQTTASGHTSQINTLNTTVGIGTAGANSVLGRLGTVETTVNGTCSGTSVSDGGNCTQGLQAQLTDLRNSYTTLQNNYSTLSANYTALQSRVTAMEACSSCSAPKADQ